MSQKGEKTPAEMTRDAKSEIVRKLEELTMRKGPDFRSLDLGQKLKFAGVVEGPPLQLQVPPLFFQSATLRDDTWISTRFGRRVDYLNPDPMQIEIGDIAWHLAHTPRFVGGTEVPYSVADHLVWCSYVAPPAFALPMLWHDAPEYVTGDLPRPFKIAVRALCGGSDPIKEIDNRIYQAILRSPGMGHLASAYVAMESADVLRGNPEVGIYTDDIIKLVDRMALDVERRDLCFMAPEFRDKCESSPIWKACEALPRIEPSASPAEAAQRWIERDRELRAVEFSEEHFRAVLVSVSRAAPENRAAVIIGSGAVERVERHLSQHGQMRFEAVATAEAAKKMHPALDNLTVNDAAAFYRAGDTPVSLARRLLQAGKLAADLFKA
jgi:hypothetical protein